MRGKEEEPEIDERNSDTQIQRKTDVDTDTKIENIYSKMT